MANDNRHHTKKARRSRGESESNANGGSEEKTHVEKTGKSNKENLKETNRLNKSAHRKRVQRLLEGKPLSKPDHASTYLNIPPQANTPRNKVK